MSATALVSARLEPNLRDGAHRVIEGYGLTQTQVIRRVYEYIVVMGDVPEFVKTDEYDIQYNERRDSFDDMLLWLETGPFSGLDLSGLTEEEVSRELASRGDYS